MQFKVNMRRNYHISRVGVERVYRRILLLLVTVVTASTVTSVAQAQKTKKYKNVLSPVDSQAIARAAAIADTGRMAPPFQNVHAYKTPGQCLVATELLQQTIWRAAEQDTMQYGENDSLPTAVRDLARECLTRMNTQTVEEVDLYDLLELSAVSGDTISMLNVVHYYNDLKNVESYRKIYFLMDAVEKARVYRVPGRVAFARSTLDKLKTYGSESILQTVRVWNNLQSDFGTRFDTTAMLRTWAEQIAYFAKFTQEQMKASNPDRISPFDSTYKFNDLMILAAYKHVPQLKDTLEVYGSAVKKATPSSAQIVDIQTHVITSRLGKDPSEMELVAGFPEGTTAVPEKGKVTLYYRFTARGLGPRVSRTFANLRLVYDKYHKDGLEIVIVTELQGYMAGSPPLEAEQEAKVHAWLIRDYLELPFAVLVNRNNTVKLEDGRIMRKPILFDQYFSEDGVYKGSNAGYIVGRDGKVQVVNMVAIGSYAQTAAFIEAELKR